MTTAKGESATPSEGTVTADDVRRVLYYAPVMNETVAAVRAVAEQSNTSVQAVIDQLNPTGSSTGEGSSTQPSEGAATAQEQPVLGFDDYRKMLRTASQAEEERMKHFDRESLPPQKAENADDAGARQAAIAAEAALEAHARDYPKLPAKQQVNSRLMIKLAIADHVRQILQCLYYPDAPFLAREAADKFAKGYGPVHALAAVFERATDPGRSLSARAAAAPTEPGALEGRDPVTQKLTALYHRYEHSLGILMSKFEQDNRPKDKNGKLLPLPPFFMMAWMYTPETPMYNPDYAYMVPLTNKLAKQHLIGAIGILTGKGAADAVRHVDDMLPDSAQMETTPDYAGEMLGKFMFELGIK